MTYPSLRRWVEIERVLLQPEERLASIPVDTRDTPLKMVVAGFLLTEQAQIGDIVQIETPIGRVWEGRFVGQDLRPIHGFGPPVPELQRIGSSLRKVLKEGVAP